MHNKKGFSDHTVLHLGHQVKTVLVVTKAELTNNFKGSKTGVTEVSSVVSLGIKSMFDSSAPHNLRPRPTFSTGTGSDVSFIQQGGQRGLGGHCG